MKLIGNEQNIFFDCDDTLVLRNDSEWNPEGRESSKRVRFKDPYDDQVYYLAPHPKHIQILKEHHARGFTVIVWSAAGHAWAKSVIETLGLEKYVDFYMTKSCKFVDDLPASEVLGQRVYIKP